MDDLSRLRGSAILGSCSDDCGGLDGCQQLFDKVLAGELANAIGTQVQL
jgi:hypothetical protein